MKDFFSLRKLIMQPDIINKYIFEKVYHKQISKDIAIELLEIINKNQEIDSDIAIIGMSGKFPDADNLKEFWENLFIEKQSIGDLPNKRKKDLDLLNQSKKIQLQDIWLSRFN